MRVVEHKLCNVHQELSPEIVLSCYKMIAGGKMPNGAN